MEIGDSLHSASPPMRASTASSAARETRVTQHNHPDESLPPPSDPSPPLLHGELHAPAPLHNIDWLHAAGSLWRPLLPSHPLLSSLASLLEDDGGSQRAHLKMMDADCSSRRGLRPHLTLNSPAHDHLVPYFLSSSVGRAPGCRGAPDSHPSTCNHQFPRFAGGWWLWTSATTGSGFTMRVVQRRCLVRTTCAVHHLRACGSCSRSSLAIDNAACSSPVMAVVRYVGFSVTILQSTVADVHRFAAHSFLFYFSGNHLQCTQ